MSKKESTKDKIFKAWKNVGTNLKGVAKDTVKEKKAQWDSENKAKRLYGKLIDTSTKKEFLKRYGQKAYNEATDTGASFNKPQGDYNKVELEMKKKYKKFK